MKIILPKGAAKFGNPNITEDKEFTPIRADLMKYHKDGEKAGFDTDPKVSISLSEDLKKHRRGIMRVSLQLKDRRISVLVHIDGIMSAIYKAYDVNSAIGEVMKENRK